MRLTPQRPPGDNISAFPCRDLRAAAGARRKKLSESQRGAAVAFAGAMAGALSRTMTAPFDRIRIVSAGTGVSISSALRIIRKEGVQLPSEVTALATKLASSGSLDAPHTKELCYVSF